MIRNRLPLLLALALFFPAFASADAPLIDGTVWTVSSEVEKESYLVGVGNLMSVEIAFHSQIDNPPSSDQTTIKKLWDGISEVSINELMATIDDWYRSNQDSMDTPALVVLWITYVEPED